MRLDLFLRASRLVLRRTIAQELCDAGAVTVNGVVARSSRSIHPGDVIEIKRRERLLGIRVITVPESKQTSKADAPRLYEIIVDKRSGDLDGVAD